VWERHTHTHTRVKGGGTNGAKYANTELYHILCISFWCTELNPFHPPLSGFVVIRCHTWAERIARQLLDALPVADGAAVEWGGVGTAASAFLVTAATAAVTH